MREIIVLLMLAFTSCKNVDQDYQNVHGVYVNENNQSDRLYIYCDSVRSVTFDGRSGSLILSRKDKDATYIELKTETGIVFIGLYNGINQIFTAGGIYTKIKAFDCLR